MNTPVPALKDNSKKRIAIIGLGNFGSALAHIWTLAGLDVTGWTVEQEVFDSIQTGGFNEKYLNDVSLAGLKVSMDLGKTVAGADIVVLALPSGVLPGVMDKLLPNLQKLKNTPVLLDLAKGLAPGGQLMSTAIEEKLSAANLHCPLCVMMGPTIARELASDLFTTALVTSSDLAVAKAVASALSTPTFKLSAGVDSLGAEYWGAFKNVIALACGVVDGLKFDGRGGDNLKAAIFAAGYREAAQLLPRLGAQADTALSVAGIGDLFVTATSPHGRNREMGERLGRGQTLAQAQEEMVMVSEGVRAARMFRNLFAGKNLEAPFVAALCALLDEGASIEEFLEHLKL